MYAAWSDAMELGNGCSVLMPFIIGRVAIAELRKLSFIKRRASENPINMS